MNEADRQARARFFAIGIIRLFGAAMVAAGALSVSGALELIPPVAGYVVLAVGVFEMLVLPPLLAARWRTPPER